MYARAVSLLLTTCQPTTWRWLASFSKQPTHAGAASMHPTWSHSFAGATFVDGLIIEREDQRYAA
jgi:hypothetical protein